MTDRRTLLVRLSDLSLDVRLRAAREAAKHEPDSAAELLAAAISPRPEHDLHWVDPSAADLLKAMRCERARAA